MESLVNVIHPYTYKLVGKNEGLSLEIGDVCKEYVERDKKIAYFVNSALKFSKILRHNSYVSILDCGLHSMAIELDPILNLLDNSKIKSFRTLPNGFPLPDKIPDNMKDDSWEILKKEIISHSNLKKKLEGNSPLIFFGGAFEACLGNIVAYCVDKYEIPGKDIFCVKDLSASFNEEMAKGVEQELINRKINIVNYEEALEIIRN